MLELGNGYLFCIAGAKLEMVLPSGTEIQGKLLEVGPQALTMNVTKTSNSKELAKGRASVPRASVSTIHARKCGAKWRVVLGIGVPAGLLGAAGAAINAQSPTVKGPEAAGVILGIGAGSAVAGYFTGRQLDCHVTDIVVIAEGLNHHSSPFSRRQATLGEGLLLGWNQ